MSRWISAASLVLVIVASLTSCGGDGGRTRATPGADTSGFSGVIVDSVNIDDFLAPDADRDGNGIVDLPQFAQNLSAGCRLVLGSDGVFRCSPMAADEILALIDSRAGDLLAIAVWDAASGYPHVMLSMVTGDSLDFDMDANSVEPIVALTGLYQTDFSNFDPCDGDITCIPPGG